MAHRVHLGEGDGNGLDSTVTLSSGGATGKATIMLSCGETAVWRSAFARII